MNNYYLNQIRRANCALPKKIYGLLLGIFCPRKVETAWRKHAREIQWRLDNENDPFSYLDLNPHKCRPAHLF